MRLPDHANIACNFFRHVLRHSGEWYGEKFSLCPWERDALRAIFGNVDEHGESLIRMAYLEMPKKTGKTEFVAGVILFILVMQVINKAKGCEIYGAASVQRQALNVYRAVTAMVEQSADLKRYVRILRSTHRIISRRDPNTFYAAIAADGDFTDGVNPKFVVADEVHRWKTRKQLENWDVLRLGGIARKHRTLTIAITTAGIQKDSPLAWRLHEKTRRIEEGLIEDPTFYGRIYAADPKDDWESEATWRKANPSLKENGGFLDIEKIREEYKASLSDPKAVQSFKRYYLSLWDQEERRAIDMQKWTACQSNWKAEGWREESPHLPHTLLEKFFGRRCWLGVDLSLSTDMSALSFVFPRDDDGWDILPFYWMPAETIRKAELRDGMPYTVWAEQGFITLSPGTAIDYGDVHARIAWGCEMFDVQDVCFDPYNSREMSTALIAEGLPCIEVPQRTMHLNESTKKFLRLVGEGKIGHGNHPVLAWNASCFCTKSDGNDLIRPVKPDRERDSTRIDGLAAAVTAGSRLIVAEDIAPIGVRSLG